MHRSLHRCEGKTKRNPLTAQHDNHVGAFDEVGAKKEHSCGFKIMGKALVQPAAHIPSGETDIYHEHVWPHWQLPRFPTCCQRRCIPYA